jgi:hypothetical protein
VAVLEEKRTERDFRGVPLCHVSLREEEGNAAHC